MFGDNHSKTYFVFDNYFDVCSVCGYAKPVKTTVPAETPSTPEEPAEDQKSGTSPILFVAIPVVLVVVAVPIGYLLIKKNKKK